MNVLDRVELKGHLVIDQIDEDGNLVRLVDDHNLIVLSGRTKIAQSLVASSNVFINDVKFGSGGANISDPTNPIPPDPSAITLTGTPIVTQSGDYVFSNTIPTTIGPTVTPKIIFSIVIPNDTSMNGKSINEMALMMNNGQAFAIKTFATITKAPTNSLNITWTIFV